MKYKLLIILVVLMLALFVSAAVPVNITWTTSAASNDAAMNVPFPGFVDDPVVGPIPIVVDKPLLDPLASISKSLVEDLSK